MKKNIVLIALLLLVIGTQKVYGCAQTVTFIDVNQSFGTVGCTGSCYLHDQIKIWFINTGNQQEVSIKYNIKTSPSTGGVYIYNGIVDSCGYVTFDGQLTNSQSPLRGVVSGTITTTTNTGCCVIVFEPGAGSYNLPYTGVTFEFNGRKVINGNLTVAGKVGIGVANPTYRVHVDGTIYANKVIAEPVEWPDHVFEESYKLLSLSEVEASIEAQGRLPGMPSAAEAEKDGVGLLEINAGLLQKVEELMLYVIEQEKRLEQQNEEILFLKERINELQQQIE